MGYHSDGTPRTPRDACICTLPADTGPCDGVCPRWFFNPSLGECQQFFWGCCEGNANNFETQEWCEAECLDPCRMPAAFGDCEAAIPRWYHNVLSGHCELFTWGGCGGNANNFLAEEDCQQACVVLQAQVDVMARILRQKRTHPLPSTKRLPESFDLSLNRDQQCASIEEFDAFEERYPLWGMPYALPGLAEEEHGVLMEWLALGAPYYPPPPAPAFDARIERWERFLNGSSNKERLMSRYIYEHLFLGNIYFDDATEPRYFRLVRSRTAPGLPIERISTRRPYDDPGIDRVFYRLQPVPTRP